MPRECRREAVGITEFEETKSAALCVACGPWRGSEYFKGDLASVMHLAVTDNIVSDGVDGSDAPDAAQPNSDLGYIDEPHAPAHIQLPDPFIAVTKFVKDHIVPKLGGWFTLKMARDRFQHCE